jgi:hypothetical protein
MFKGPIRKGNSLFLHRCGFENGDKEMLQMQPLECSGHKLDQKVRFQINFGITKENFKEKDQICLKGIL